MPDYSRQHSIALRRRRVPVWLIENSVSNPKIVLCIWVALVFIFLPGTLNLRVDTSTDSVLDRGSEEWSYYESSQDRFGGDEIVVVAISSEEPYGEDELHAHVRLSREFGAIDGVARVDSLATLPSIRVDSSGDLLLTPALEMDGPVSAEEAVSEFRRVVEADRIYKDTLVSRDGRTTAISLVLEPGRESHQQKILAEIEGVIGDHPAAVSGVPVFRVAANATTRSEIVFFSIATGLALAALLYLVFRSVRAICVALIPGGIGVVIVASIMGYSDIPISISTMILPSMLVAIGCAFTMHVLVATAGVKTSAEFVSAALPVGLPLILSGLTTAVGLLSLTMIGIDAVSHIGLFGAIGVFVVTVCALTFAPAVLQLFPIERLVARRVWIPKWLDAHEIYNHRRGIICFWAGILVVSLLGLTRLEVETDVTTWFAGDHVVRVDYEEIKARLSGISPMNVVIEVRPGDSILDPDLLSKIDRLSDYLESQPEVGKAISISDPLRQMHMGFQPGAGSSLPQSQALAEQYMVMLDGVEMIRDVVTADRESANIMLRVDDNSSANLLDVADRATRWWEEFGFVGASVRVTGIMFEFARAEDEIAYGQLMGLGAAFAVVGLIFLAIFADLKLALLALIPNAIPLMIIFGAMGYLSIPLDAGTVLIGGLALGIAVDDTIHLATRYVSHAAVSNRPPDAFAQALQEVLPAISISTLLISTGFGIFAISDFSLIRNLGWLTSSVMLACLLADVFFLGALMMSVEVRRQTQVELEPEAF